MAFEKKKAAPPVGKKTLLKKKNYFEQTNKLNGLGHEKTHFEEGILLWFESIKETWLYISIFLHTNCFCPQIKLVDCQNSWAQGSLIFSFFNRMEIIIKFMIHQPTTPWENLSKFWLEIQAKQLYRIVNSLGSECDCRVKNISKMLMF